jgi:hypothetical protein
MYQRGKRGNMIIIRFAYEDNQPFFKQHFTTGKAENETKTGVF